MVATTKGPANSKRKTATPPPAPEKGLRDMVTLDDETWGRVMQQAASQQSTPEEVVARSLEQVFGKGQPTVAQGSGVDLS